MILLLASALGLAGCAKQDEDAPEIALGDQPGQAMQLGRPPADLSLLGDQTAVKTLAPPTLTYDPLPRVSRDRVPERDDLIALNRRAARPTDDGDEALDQVSDETGEPAAGRTRKPREGTEPGRSRLGKTLSDLTHLIPTPGRRPPPGRVPSQPTASAPPPVEEPDPWDVEDDESALEGQDDESTKPSAEDESTKEASKYHFLVEAREPIDRLPDSSAGFRKEDMNTARNTALVEAERSLVRYAFELSLDESRTVTQAVGEVADDFVGSLSGVQIVEARWVDENTLEIVAQISIDRLIDTLAAVYQGVSFEGLRRFGATKAIEATGRSYVAHTGDD
jgi:hypothetical protein